MIDDFAGKTAVLTGAGSGFGLECARLGASKGMNLVLVDVQQDALDAAAAELTAVGATVLARDVALTVQGALLAQSAPPAVVGACCDSRLASRHDVFGTLGAGADLDALVARAQLA